MAAEILLNGLQRLDETKMVRKVFPSSGVVLERTGTPPPPSSALLPEMVLF